MPAYSVRFKGPISGTHRARLREAGVVIESSEPGMRVGTIKIGQSIHTVRVEAGSIEDALATAMEAIAPDDVNFTEWQAGPL
jgi:hypothetical protein